MTQTRTTEVSEDRFNRVDRYEALMDVVRNRMTNRAFDPSYEVPRKHYEMILEADRIRIAPRDGALTFWERWWVSPDGK